MKAYSQRLITPLVILWIALLAGCHKNDRVSLPGYVQGRFTYISTYFAGVVTLLNVAPGEQVKPGQPLFTLEPLPQRADMLVADARVQQAIEQKNKNEAHFDLQKSMHDRNLLLFKKEVISREELDTSKESYQQAYLNKKESEANLLAEKANQSKSLWAFQKKTVKAPMQSLVFDTYYSEHENVPAGSPVLSLLAPGNIKIIFFAPENMISKLKLHQFIDISCDGCSEPIKGKITYLSPKAEYTPPVIFSSEERQKLVFRVEALPIVSDVLLNIHPGQPVEVTFNINNS